MGATFIYNKAAEQAVQGNLDFDGDVIRALLVTASYTPNVDDDFVNSGPAANEVSGGNYSRLTVQNPSVALDDANDRVDLDGDDLSFGAPTSGQDVIACIFYKQVGGDDTTPGDDYLVVCGAFGGGDVASIDTANDEITVPGDETGNFANGDDLQLHGHPTHDGTHTLDGAPSLDGNGDTVLPVSTDLTDGTAQGTVFKILTTDGNKVDVSIATNGLASLVQP